MKAPERFHLTAAVLLGLLIWASLVGCSSHHGSAAASVASSSIERSILTSSNTVTPRLADDRRITSHSQSSLAAPIRSTTTARRTSETTDTAETTVTSAGSCNPTLITFKFEPVEPTYRYPYPQGAAVPPSCAGAAAAGTITMQVGDSVRMTVQRRGLQVGPLSATPHNLVKLSGDIIFAEHPGTVHIYTGRESLCRLIEVSMSRCELLTLRIGY